MKRYAFESMLFNQLMGGAGGGGGGGAAPAANPGAAGAAGGSVDPGAGAAGGTVDPGQQQQQQQQQQQKPAGILTETGEFNPNWYQGNADLEPYANALGKFKDPIGLAKSYGILEKNRQVPGADASEEAVAAYRAVNGIPDSADGYKFELSPDLPQEVQDAIGAELPQWQEKFLEANVTPEQAQKLVGFQTEVLQNLMKEQETAQFKAEQEAQAQLQKDWGVKYDANLDGAQQAADYLAAKAGVDLSDAPFLNDPRFAKMMAAVRAETDESKFVKTGNDTTTPSAGGKFEADKIITDKNHPDYAAYWNPSDSRHQEVTQRVARMMAQEG